MNSPSTVVEVPAVPAVSGTPASSSMSLDDMARVIDVARALRDRREHADQQFRREELRAELEAKLLEAAKAAGRDIGPGEIEAAIDLYLSNLHTFREPPWSWAMVFAHFYIRRRLISIAVVGLALGWWLFLSSTGPFSARARQTRLVSTAADALDRQAELIRGLTKNPAILADLQQRLDSAVVHQKQGAVQPLQQLTKELADEATLLQQEYTLEIVSDPGRKSGIDSYYTDKDGTRVAGYYVFVEAKDPKGQLVRRTIKNVETGKTETVTVWGERVPTEVYERLKEDRKSDGVLNETLFGRKRRGELDDEVLLPGPDGKPLTRQAQITSW